MQQESILFRDTIENNLKISAEMPKTIEDDIVQRAIQIAMLSGTIIDFPDGIKTFLEEAGNDLSGGQRQRLAIARAIIRNTPVLILDEAMSALEITSRSLVLDAIRSWRRGRTTIIITHDIAQIGANDRVIVMQDGQVVQQGYRYMLENDQRGAFMTLVSDSHETRTDADQKFPTKNLMPEIQNRASIPRGRNHRSQIQRLSLADKRKSLSNLLYGEKHDNFIGFSNSRWSFADFNSSRWQNNHLRSSPSPFCQSVAERPYSEFQIDDYLDFDNPAELTTEQESRCSGIAARATILRGPVVPDLSDVSGSEVEEVTCSIASAEKPPGLFSFVKLALWSQNRKLAVFVGLGFAVISGVSMPAFSYTFSHLLASIFPKADGEPGSTSVLWPLIVLLVSAIDALFTFANILVLEIAGERWIYRLRRLAFQKVLTRDYSWFITPISSASIVPKVGAAESIEQILQEKSSCHTVGGRSAVAISNIVINDSEDTQLILSRFIGPLISSAFMMTAGILWAFAVGWQLTLVGLGVAPIAVLTGRYMSSSASKWTELYNTQREEYLAIAYEV